MKVRLHPAARDELREAYHWYHERSPLTATAFAQGVDVSISAITQSPLAYPLAEHGTRRFALQRFPFHIFYRVEKTEIAIIALAHQRLSPATGLVECLKL